MSRLAILMLAVPASWSASIGYCVDDVAYEALASDAVLVTVDERPITKGDLEFELLWRQAPPQQQSALRRQFVEELVDRQLLSAFLAQRRVDVPGELIDRQLDQLRQLIAAADRDFDDVISSLGFSEESLRAHLELPLAWRMHLHRVVTDRQLTEYFDARRTEFDGTRVRGSQIVIAVDGDAGEEEWRAAEQTLSRVRSEIAAGEIEFAEAARRHSTSPSREQGGDLGFFTFRGTVPEPVASAAFALETGELSHPLRSPFGVHLLQITDRVAGQLSLEDVRDEVFDRISQQMWDDEAGRLRGEARIEWRIDLEVLGE